MTFFNFVYEKKTRSIYKKLHLDEANYSKTIDHGIRKKCIINVLMYLFYVYRNNTI